MSLQPGTNLLHYRITGKIGEGGMGAVYRATDSKLDRDVALKVLPQEMAADPSRLERFQREARAVAALNHPHIVTLFSVEQDGDTHFLTMELVEGKSLDQTLPPGGLPLARVFDIGIALADALASAHEKGIVHRDLKPANVMLSGDGKVKVLDFGLAKLAAEDDPASIGDPDAASADTAAVSLTQAGTVMGTAPYMSPEQLEGKAVDHRTDIFALGVMLYEICTGNRPFQGNTSASLISAIMRDAPRPVNELRQDMPRHLARIVGHCLAKSVTDRYQSALDVRNELRGLRREIDSGASLTSDGLGSGGIPTVAMPSVDRGFAASSPAPTAESTPAGSPVSEIGPASRSGSRLAMTLAVLVGVTGLAFGIFSFLNRPDPVAVAAKSFQELNLSTLMSRNDLADATLSSDGRYLAYVTFNAPTFALTVRQVRTGSDIAIIEDSAVPIRGIRFSLDGDYLYFLNRDPELPNYNALFQVPSLGGTPSKIAFDVDSAPSFSPDGTRFVFRRGLIDKNADSLVVATAGSADERELARMELPQRYIGDPAWSPDGRHIAVSIQTATGGFRSWVEAIEVDSGDSGPVGESSWIDVGGPVWGPGGKSILLNAFELGAGNGPQIYRLSFPDGATARMTNDLDGYGNLSVSNDGGTLAVVRRSQVSNIWFAPENGEPNPITSASGSADSIGGIWPATGGSVIYTAPRDSYLFLWRIDADGSNRRQLTTRGVFAFNLQGHPSAGVVYNQVVRNDGGEGVTSHVWRVRPDGTAEPLTDGAGEQLVAVSPAGNAIVFQPWGESNTLWVQKLDGSEPYRLSKGGLDTSLFSWDGERIMITALEGEQDSAYPQRYILPLDGGEPLASFRLPPGATDIRWVPGADALTYVDRGAGWNLMRREVPDGKPVALTSYTDGQVVEHVWHPDGSRLLLHRRAGRSESLLQMKIPTGALTRIAEFKTGHIREHDWSPDTHDVYFSYATSSQDVVLIRGYE